VHNHNPGGGPDRELDKCRHRPPPPRATTGKSLTDLITFSQLANG
jgi:hypothetical protein